jgi:PmbA protein
MILKILQRHVDEAIVVKTRIRNYMVRFANNEITVFKNWDVENTYIYLAKGRRTTFLSATGSPDLAQIEEAVKRLSSLPEDPLYVPVEGPRLPTRRESPEDFEKLPDLVKRAVDSAAGVERSAGVVNLAYVEVEYEDSAGRGGQYAVNRVYMTMRSFLGELSATAATAGRRVADIKAEKLGEENTQLLSLAKGLPQRRIEPTKADLLLSPLVFGHLVGELLYFWTNGSEVVANSSRYTKEDVGRQAASELLTVVEKTYDESAHGYVPFDFEGTPPRPVEVYRRGVLGGFIHTRRTAHALGMEPTGHALYGWARPVPGHVEVAPGDGPADLETLLADLRNGFYIHGNWYTRYQNVKIGQFSTVGRDVVLEVKDGRPTAVVKYIRIADTMENIVKNVAELSKAPKQVYWWDMPTPANAPYAIIRQIGITT